MYKSSARLLVDIQPSRGARNRQNLRKWTYRTLFHTHSYKRVLWESAEILFWTINFPTQENMTALNAQTFEAQNIVQCSGRACGLPINCAIPFLRS